MKTTPRFGVNYVPSKNWWYCWSDWDADSVLEDFRALARLGIDHIRIQLIWPVFQPNPSMLNELALKRLRELMDLADQPDTGLDVMVTVLDGWLSGFAFKPAWLRGRCMITDPDVIDAELRLFEAVAAEVANHPKFLGFDLSNEPSVTNEGVLPADGDKWAVRLLEHCEALAPGSFHVNGVDHRPWLDHTTFSPEGSATAGAASILHCYPYWTGVLDKWGPDGIGTLHLGEFMAELAEAHAQGPNRLKWLQEFGASAVERPEASIPGWAEAFIRNTLSSSNMWGCTWWGSHDIDRRLTAFDEYEYDLGLLTIRNETKPTGARIAQLIASLRSEPIQPLVRSTALVIPSLAPARDAADHFFRLIEQGVRPAIVTLDRSRDEAYLAGRGITDLVHTPGA